jgi:hypothetical protein
MPRKKRVNGKWPFKFVEVVWEDTFSDSKWRSVKEPPDHVIVHSRGWLINDTKRNVTVAASIVSDDDGDMSCGDVTTIPRGCIKEITDLGV